MGGLGDLREQGLNFWVGFWAWMMGPEGLLIHLGVIPADLTLEVKIRVGA